MNEKELRRLNRSELLEMLIAQTKKTERLEKELAEATKSLEERELNIREAGTMAEAALRLNNIFEAADKAAAEYLESIRVQANNASKLYESTELQANSMLRDAEARAERLIAEAEVKSAAICADAAQRRQAVLAEADEERRKQLADFQKQFAEFLSSHS